jgi:hypothetical protein
MLVEINLNVKGMCSRRLPEKTVNASHNPALEVSCGRY